MERESLFNFAKPLKVSICQDQELAGHLPIELSFLLRNFLSRDGSSLELLLTGVRILKDGHLVPSGYTTF